MTSMHPKKVINSKTTIEMQQSSFSSASSASSVKSQSSMEESSKVNLMVLPAIDHTLITKASNNKVIRINLPFL